jgi:hypothetical protein
MRLKVRYLTIACVFLDVAFLLPLGRRWQTCLLNGPRWISLR